MKKIISYLNYMCYNVIRIGKVFRVNKGSESNMNNGIVDAKVLANYIIERNHGEISPIKLQKSLYFCFAYWGGFVRKMRTGQNEMGNTNYCENLFPERIEAWVYGPVVPDVYHEKNIKAYKSKSKNIFNDDFVKSYIDGVLDDVLKSNDFKLVEVSHQDRCWKKHYKPKSLFHNCEIPHDEIIEEYATTR